MTPSETALSEEQEAATEIVRAVFGQDPTQPPFLVGRGLVNQVYGTQVDGRTMVVRFCHDKGAASDHQKEAWCIERAAESGVPGPTVLKVGTLGDISYMIQTFLEGTKGEEARSLWPHVWKELGRYARLTHSVAATGFGGQLADSERGLFSNAHPPTWADYINYNIASLKSDDALLRLGVYSVRQRREVVTLFETLNNEGFRFGLCHSDLKPRNTVVGPMGEVYLLDWGSAGVHIVPHADLGEILRWQDPEGPNVRAFLDGYGLSWGEFSGLLPQVQALQLIGAFDLVRWAIDCRPDRLAGCAARARRITERTLCGTPWEVDQEKWDSEQA